MPCDDMSRRGLFIAAVRRVEAAKHGTPSHLRGGASKKLESLGAVFLGAPLRFSSFSGHSSLVVASLSGLKKEQHVGPFVKRRFDRRWFQPCHIHWIFFFLGQDHMRMRVAPWLSGSLFVGLLGYAFWQAGCYKKLFLCDTYIFTPSTLHGFRRDVRSMRMTWTDGIGAQIDSDLPDWSEFVQSTRNKRLKTYTVSIIMNPFKSFMMSL